MAVLEAGHRPRYPALEAERKQLKKRIDRKLRREEKWFTTWAWMNYVLGIPATLLAGVSAWQGFTNSPTVAAIAAAVSGTLAAFNTTLSPRKQAERHATAKWNLEELNDDVEDIPLESIDEYADARDQIHGYKHKLVAIEREVGFAEIQFVPQPAQQQQGDG
jgi:hypothetical protein